MHDPLRTAPASDGSPDPDRDALIERLLLAGLDHYFEGRYEQAVNVWTRVAFLERGHGRARAYIDRARGALAEQQRESDELLHRGLDAYRAGDLAGARDLLTRAVADGGSETALLFLQRLGIAEAGHAASALLPQNGDESGSRRQPFRSQGDGPESAPTNWFATIALSAVVATAIILTAQPIASWLGDRAPAAPAVSPRPAESIPVLRSAETRLGQARALFAAGRPNAALQVLDAIDRGDPLRGEADALTATIQNALLAAVVSGAGAPEPDKARPIDREAVR
jgi:hypothetical protein